MRPERSPELAAGPSRDLPAEGISLAGELDPKRRSQSAKRPAGWLCLALIALGLGVAASSLLGPLGLGLMRYRTSETTLNQLLGSDAAALFIVAPLTLVAAVLVARSHPVGPLLALGVGVYALYTYPQIIIGQEYLRLPGNVERFFPLLLAVFLAAEAVVVLAWRLAPATPRPALWLERTAAAVLLLVAAFLVFGQHLRPILAAWQNPASLTEYASSPTPFWMVKLMDLGIIVPAAVATAVGLLKGAGWARRAMYVLFTGYTCLAISVAAMGVVMYANADPDASLALAGGFLVFALVFAALTVLLYRPFLGQSDRSDGRAS
jgi:hypothetical protein